MRGSIRWWANTSLAGAAICAAIAAGGAARAADLGGDCCGDLEERVAELEATTARKGNRKVSLTVSGQVNETIQWWDDGGESNIYQGTAGADPTQVRFVGKAKINKDWSAGYIIEIGLAGAAVGSYSQDNDDNQGSSGAVNLRHSAWFLESKSYGKLTVGQTSAVNDGITEYSTPKNVIAKPIEIFSASGGFFLRQTNGVQTGLTWGNLARGINGAGEGNRYNVVRYDSPEFGGFVASANWGEDDLWAVALRYSGELQGFKIAGGISFAEVTDGTQNLSVGPTAPTPYEGNEWGGSISVLHVESGLFASFAYGEAEIGGLGALDDEFTNWNVRAGIQKKWAPLGNTTLYGEYFKGDFGAAGSGGGTTAFAISSGNNVLGSDVDVWGLGAIQDIEAAALQVYIGYRHYEADLHTSGAAVSIDDFDTVIAGSKISF